MASSRTPRQLCGHARGASSVHPHLYEGPCDFGCDGFCDGRFLGKDHKLLSFDGEAGIIHGRVHLKQLLDGPLNRNARHSPGSKGGIRAREHVAGNLAGAMWQPYPRTPHTRYLCQERREVVISLCSHFSDQVFGPIFQQFLFDGIAAHKPTNRAQMYTPRQLSRLEHRNTMSGPVQTATENAALAGF